MMFYLPSLVYVETFSITSDGSCTCRRYRGGLPLLYFIRLLFHGKAYSIGAYDEDEIQQESRLRFQSDYSLYALYILRYIPNQITLLCYNIYIITYDVILFQLFYKLLMLLD